MTTSHWKKIFLNPQQYVNVLLPNLFHKIVILSVHQFIMTSILINLAIPHFKLMHHHSTMNEKIMRKNMEKNLWIVKKEVYKEDTTGNMYINRMKYCFDWSHLKTLCTNWCILEPGWNYWYFFVYWFEWCITEFTVLIQCKKFIFKNAITSISRSSSFWK